MDINLEILLRPFFPSHLLFPGPGNRLVSSRYQEDKFPPIILKQVQSFLAPYTANLFFLMVRIGMASTNKSDIFYIKVDYLSTTMIIENKTMA